MMQRFHQHTVLWIRIFFILSFLLASCSNVQDANNIVITFAAPKRHQSVYESLIAEFHKQHPEIAVQFVLLDGNSDSPGNMGDTVRVGSLPKNPQSQFLNIQPLIDGDSSFDTGDFWPRAMEGCRGQQGNQLGIPITLTVQVIYYQKAAFDKQRVAYPQPAWTWDDFRQTINALADPGGENPFYGFVDDPRGLLLSPLVDHILTAESGEVNPETISNKLDWYLNLTSENKLYAVNQYDERRDLLTNAQAGMWIDSFGSGDAGSNHFAPFPVSDQIEVTNPVHADCAAISAGSQHPQAAWEWLKFLSKQSSEIDLSMGTIPARQSVTYASNVWRTLSSETQQLLRYSLDHAWYRAEHPEELILVMDAFSNAISKQTSLSQALKENLASSTPVPQPTLPESTVVVRESKPTESADQIEIRYFASGARSTVDLRQRMSALITKYEQEHPEVKITYEFALPRSGDSFWKSMADSYDCFSWGTPSWGIIPTDLLLDLRPLVEIEDPDFIQDYPELMLDIFQTETGLYGLPAEGDAKIVAFNSDLISKQGIEIPSEEWTYHDFIRTATLASSGSESDPSHGLLSLEYALLLAGRGVQWPERTDTNQVLIDTPDAANFLAWLSELERSGVILHTPLFPPDMQARQARQQAVQSGQIVFWTSHLSTAGLEYFSNQSPPFRVEMLPLPSDSNGEPLDITQLTVTKGHYISSQTEHTSTCWDWIKFLSQQPELFGGLPARESVLLSSALEAKIGVENLKIYQSLLSESKEGIVSRANNPIETPLLSWRMDVLQRILDGEDIQQVLDQTQSEVDAYMSCLSKSDLSALDPDEIYNSHVLPCLNEVRPDLARGLGFGL